ncbi:MAG TPA: TIGR01777 family oxidoreductase [Verrucomicrobiae bacterium]|jgi:hypothetical protein
MKTRSNRIVLAGGSGFLGRLLARSLAARGNEITILTRSAPAEGGGTHRRVQWDARTLGPWRGELEGAAAVINLAGRSVNCRYNAANRRLIMDSRILSTQVLGQAIAACAEPPPVWLNAGTATIYKHSFDKAMDETGAVAADRDAKDEFSVEVAQAWEAALDAARTPATRKVALRMSMVFASEEGTVFRVLRRLVRLGLGGSMAGGRQFVAWIHQEDFCRAVEWALEHPALNGPLNIVSPNPLPNREMMATFRKVCGMPVGLPAARWMLEAGAWIMRTETELIIKSRRVVPGKLLASGFQFQHPNFQEALEEIEGRL